MAQDEGPTDKEKKQNGQAMKYFSLSLVGDAVIFYRTCGGEDTSLWAEICNTYDLKGGEDLLKLMTDFAQYMPELHVRTRIWFLQLQLTAKRINDAGSSKTAADIVLHILDKAPLPE